VVSRHCWVAGQGLARRHWPGRLGGELHDSYL